MNRPFSTRTKKSRLRIYKRMLEDWEKPFKFKDDIPVWAEGRKKVYNYTEINDATTLLEEESNNYTDCGFCDYITRNSEHNNVFINVSYKDLIELRDQGETAMLGHFGYDKKDPQADGGYLWGYSDQGRANRVEALKNAIELLS